MNPIISIVNESETVTDADLKRKLLALQKQITRDFEPVWGWGANLRFNAKKFDMQVIVKDTDDEGGFLGFHIKDGKPITYIFAEDDIADSGEYTSTLSHELLEMIADPIKTIENPPRLTGPPCPRISHGEPPTAFLVRQLFVFELLDCPLEVALLQIDKAYPGVIPTEGRVALEHLLKLR